MDAPVWPLAILFHILFATCLTLNPHPLTSPTSTNHLTLPPALTARADFRCHKILNPPQPGLNPTNCEATIATACKKGRGTFWEVPYDEWVWTSTEGCSLGWYIPDTGKDWDPHPYPLETTFMMIIRKCGTDSRFNAGSYNVEEMPGLFGNGTAIDARKVRYIMAPQQLTR